MDPVALRLQDDPGSSPGQAQGKSEDDPGSSLAQAQGREHETLEKGVHFCLGQHTVVNNPLALHAVSSANVVLGWP